jgi:hypothetical protein
MRLRKKESTIQEHEIEMTPFIDVIFQLVLFFVFSLKFLAFEGTINAYLPKNRGLESSADFSKELRQVTLFLEWREDAEGGMVYLRTFNFQPPGGGQPIDDYTFPMDPGVMTRTGATGQPVRVTETRMVTDDGNKGGAVTYDYGAPDFNSLEEYLRSQKEAYDKKVGLGAGLRLTVNFETQIPWQMVVNVVDICTRLGITDFALNPLELEY